MLDEASNELQVKLPGRSWGFARKSLNVFLRDCLYNVYLREQNHLDQAEYCLEIPLDSIVAEKIRECDRFMPRWRNIRDLDCHTNEFYQVLAAEIAENEGYARVHLDAVWWGRRED